MAVRPVFVATLDQRQFAREEVEFLYYSGFSLQQQRRCIQSLHQAFAQKHPGRKVLEISSKSEQPLGVQLSAFHLTLKTPSGREVTVEAAFQAGKVFAGGGPYTDLLCQPPWVAKRDQRLKSSGPLVGFSLEGEPFPNQPVTYFYNWLYINALSIHPEESGSLLEYTAFTDIAFNPKKSRNCQAEAAAIYVSLQRQGLLAQALQSREAFLQIVYPEYKQPV